MKRITATAIIIAVLSLGFVSSAALAQEGSAVGSKVGAGAATAPAPVKLTLPVKEGSVRFMVVGDTGTGTEQQNQLARVMMQYHGAFPYEFALLLGDNMYGAEKAEDFRKKFEDVYRGLLERKVKFYATLGNHDESNQRFYEYFNMNGEEYINFKKGNASFYSLNSNYMDKKQVKWMEE